MRQNKVNAIDLWQFEREALSNGYSIIAGVDEAGRGPLAGPVVAAAVILPFECDTKGIFDSKQLSGAARDSAFRKIHESAIGIGVGIIEPDEIDRVNILQATYNAMRAAIREINQKVDLCLVDGNPIPKFGFAHRGIVKGDAKSASIAAASIIAKVTRDRIMCEYDDVYPQYGFAKHKGYPTEEHIAMLSIHGICKIHRRSFGPVARAEEEKRVWAQTELLWDKEENVRHQNT